MPENKEFKTFEIPHSTLRAAQILNCDPQTLMGLYDSEFHEEIKDNQFLEAQMDKICTILENFFDPEDSEEKTKIRQAIEIDPFFREFVTDFFIRGCAYEMADGPGFLSVETFEGMLTFIYSDEALVKRLDEATENLEKKLKEIRVQEILHEIRQLIRNILISDLDKQLSHPDSCMSRVHRLVFRVRDGEALPLNELKTYKNHVNFGGCNLCDVIDIRKFESFEEFLQFLKDAREIEDLKAGKNSSMIN